MDYSLQDGSLRMKLRAATAGYTLRKWSVDCSPDHSLRNHEFMLWLKDSLALYGVKNALLVPGYRPAEKNQGETCYELQPRTRAGIAPDRVRPR